MTQNEIQEKAVQLFIENNYRGYLDYSVGVGKSKITIDIIDHVKSRLDNPNILIGIPMLNLQENWEKEFIKWGKEELLQYVKFTSHRSAYKYLDTEVDLYIGDECHLELTHKYKANLGFPNYLGLSGTISENKEVILFENNVPRIDKITQKEAVDLGFINKTVFIKVEYELSSKLDVEIIGKNFKTSDLKNYNYYHNLFNECKLQLASLGYESIGTNVYSYLESEHFKKQDPKAYELMSKMSFAMSRRKKILFTSNSSVRCARMVYNLLVSGSLIHEIKDPRVIVFGEETETLDRICKNTVHSNKHKNKKECAKINKGTIERFNNKEFKALAASKQVNQGQNFVDLNVAIYQSYNSSSTNKGQRDGRLARLPKNRIGYNIYLVAKGTVMESWFNNLSANEDVIVYPKILTFD